MASQDLIFRFLGIDAGAGRQFDRMAAKAGATAGITSKLALGFTAAGATVAVASVKMATQFQSSMELLRTQAGASQHEVDAMRSAVLSLAGPTATAPDELAKGLYHIESTGFRGAKALGILKVAAEGARIGQADLEDVTNAMNAAVASGIPGVQNMSQAMGALNAVVGSGDMRMQDLADALGTGVLAVVKGFGLSLNDVGAALATFGDNNIRGADAATALRMAVQSIARPAASGKDAIHALGLQMDTLATAQTKGGLAAALALLHDRLEATGNTGAKTGQVLTEAFGKRAGIGLQVLIEQYARFQSKQEEVAKGARGFAADWTATTQTLSYRLGALRSSVESLGIRVGTVLLPAVSDLIGGITATGHAVGDTIGFLNRNRDAVEALAVTIGVALIPKLVAMTVAAARFLAEDIGIRLLYARDAVTKLGATLAATNPLLIAGTIAVGGLAYAWLHARQTVSQYQDEIRNATDPKNASSFAAYKDTLVKSVKDIEGAYAGLQNRSVGFNLLKNLDFYALPGLAKSAEEANRQVAMILSNIQGLAGSSDPGALQATFATAQRMGLGAGELAGNFDKLQAKVNAYLATNGKVPDAADRTARAIAGLQSPVLDAQTAIDDLTNAIKGLVSAPIAADQAAEQFRADLQALGAAAAGTTRSISMFTKAGRDNRDKVRAAASDVADLVSRWQDEGQTLDQIRPKLLAHERALRDTITAFLGSRTAADQLLQRWHLLPSQIDQLAGPMRQAGVDAGKGLIDGVSVGMQSETNKMLDLAFKLGGQAGKAVQFGARVDSPSKITTYVGKMLAEGLIVGFTGESSKVYDKLSKTTQSLLDRFSADISTARSARQGTKQALAGYADLSGMGQSTATDSFGVAMAATPNVRSYLRGKAADLHTFSTLLRRLDRQGLSPALLNQFASVGPDAIPAMRQLLHTGRHGIKDVNRVEQRIQHYAGSAATLTTTATYGSQLHKDLERLPKKLGREIAHEFRHLKVITNIEGIDSRQGKRVLAH